MANIALATQQMVQEMLTAAFRLAIDAGELPNGNVPAFVVEVPADTSKGDFATNAAMVSARAFGLPPRKIAEILAARLPLDGSFFDRVEIAGPGFLNFFVSPRWFARIVAEILEGKEQYGRSDHGKGEKVMVEFVSANPTGPMHMGNARGGAIGDCLASALDWAGYNVTREFYVNDAGNQIEKFGLSLEARYLQHFKGEEAVPFPEDGYFGDDITAHAKAFAGIYGEKYVNAPTDERRQILVDYALPLNIEKLRSDLERYRIVYDVWFRESSLYPDGVAGAVEALRQKGAVYEQDGAVWYRATDFGAEKDEVLIRQNGHPTYFAADIAYHYHKFAVRGFSRVINVWGADHHGHVARLKGAMDAIGLDGSKLDIVLMQLVRLLKDGHPFKMSKRTGKSVTLSDLLEEVEIDAARFFFNMREPNSALDFDLTLAAEQSSQNPVYYVQYAHARICSILKNLAAQGIAPRETGEAELLLLCQPEEQELIRLLGQLPGEIVGAAVYYDPARLTRFAIDVATLFHKFYNTHRVKGEEEALLQARLALCQATGIVLRNLLSLLKITAPEIM